MKKGKSLRKLLASLLAVVLVTGLAGMDVIAAIPEGGAAVSDVSEAPEEASDKVTEEESVRSETESAAEEGSQIEGEGFTEEEPDEVKPDEGSEDIAESDPDTVSEEDVKESVMEETSGDVELVSDTDYKIWVGKDHVTSDKVSGEGWEYDPESNILTLSNAHITDYSEVEDYPGRWEKAGIYIGSDSLIINLVGNNIIDENCGDTDEKIIGIIGGYDNDEITFSGAGHLDISDCYTGIRAERNLLISGAEVSSEGKYSGVRVLYGELSVDGGSLYAKKTGLSGSDYGLYAGSTHKDVVLSSGTLVVDSVGDGVNIRSNLKLDGGTFTVRSKGAYAVNVVEGSIQISDDLEISDPVEGQLINYGKRFGDKDGNTAKSVTVRPKNMSSYNIIAHGLHHVTRFSFDSGKQQAYQGELVHVNIDKVEDGYRFVSLQYGPANDTDTKYTAYGNSFIMPGYEVNIYFECAEIIKYPFYVGGVQVNDQNKSNIFGDNTASYVGNAGGGVLTLSNADISGAYQYSEEADETANIYSDQEDFELEIALTGENSLSEAGRGILLEGSANELDLYGNGSLKIVSSKYAIVASDITFSDGTELVAPKGGKLGSLGEQSKTVFRKDDTTAAEKVILGKPVDMSNAVITLGAPLTYDGEEKTQEVASVTLNGKEIPASDYTITGNTGTNAGQYELTVTGSEDSIYSGEVKKQFTIGKLPVSPVVTVTGEYTFNDLEPIIPTMSVKVGDTELNTADYTVSATDNCNAGTGKVTVSAAENSNYIFSDITEEFVIKKAVYDKTDKISFTGAYACDHEEEVNVDLREYLPEKCGTVEYGTPVSSGNLVFKTVPSIAEDVLSFTLKAADDNNSGTIVIDATTQNYSNEFTITMTVEQKAMVLYEKINNELTKCTEKNLNVGKSFTLIPSFVDETVTNKRVVWKSSNPDIATVSQDGKVVALAAGETKISAMSELNPDTYSECNVIVKEPVTEVILDKKSYSMGAGESVLLDVQMLPLSASPSVIWTSGNPEVVMIYDETGVTELTGSDTDTHRVMLKALKAGTAKITAMAADGSGKKAVCTVSVGNPVSGFTIAGKGKVTELAYGKTLAMKVTWEDAKKKPKNTGVEWKVEKIEGEGDTAVISDAAGIAEISAKGVLKGLSEGRVRVTATSTANPEKKATEDINIYIPVKSVKLNTTSGTVGTSAESGSLQLQVYLTAADGSLGTSENEAGPDGKCDISGSNATGTVSGSAPVVTFSVDDKYKSLIEVGACGSITAKPDAAATRNIPVKATITAYGGYSKTLTCKVNVAASNPLKSIKLSKTKLSVGEGNTADIKITLKPVNPDGGSRIAWKSSDESIAAVDENGNIIGKKEGVASITFTTEAKADKNGKPVQLSAVCKVTVTPSVNKVDFTNAEQLAKKGLATGKTYSLKTALEYSGESKAATNSLTWISSDTSVATVSNKGVVKALSPGTVTVTAKSADKKIAGEAPGASITFNTYATVKSIKADKKKMTVGTQTGSEYGRISIVKVLPVNATYTSVLWTTGNDGIKLAAIDRNADSSTGEFKTALSEEAGVITAEDQVLVVMGVKPGVTRITGIATDGSKKKVTCTVTVRGKATGLKLTESAGKNGLNDVTIADNEGTTEVEYTSSMKAGAKQKLKPLVDIEGISASVTDKTKKQYAAYKKYTDVSVSYRSSNTAVAVVDKSGTVKIASNAAAGSTADIYAVTSDGVSIAKLTVTVK